MHQFRELPAPLLIICPIMTSINPAAGVIPTQFLGVWVR
ncbi:hypothetical protein GFS31_02550 [Leptolyngbya sp. BL0902]|nr:hypothetical protein GFS31_02550 [Leptolyngbya sp. BL0902]